MPASTRQSLTQVSDQVQPYVKQGVAFGSIVQSHKSARKMLFSPWSWVSSSSCRSCPHHPQKATGAWVLCSHCWDLYPQQVSSTVLVDPSRSQRRNFRGPQGQDDFRTWISILGRFGWSGKWTSWFGQGPRLTLGPVRCAALVSVSRPSSRRYEW